MFKTFCGQPAQKSTNFAVAGEAVRNNYWSHNLIGLYCFWVISPRNSTLFTRPGGARGLDTRLKKRLEGLDATVSMRCHRNWNYHVWDGHKLKGNHYHYSKRWWGDGSGSAVRFFILLVGTPSELLSTHGLNSSWIGFSTTLSIA